MQKRAQINNDSTHGHQQNVGECVMSQLQYALETTAGDSTLAASSLLAGVIKRTGPGGAYNDTLPTVAQLLAAAPHLSVGDSFSFIIRNTVAFAETIVAGTGWTLGSNTANAASKAREYLVTINSAAPTKVISATTTNGNKVLSNVSDADLKQLVPGMVLNGTGIAGGTLILVVNPDNNTVLTDTNSTASGNNIAITANPTATLEGVRSADI